MKRSHLLSLLAIGLVIFLAIRYMQARGMITQVGSVNDLPV